MPEKKSAPKKSKFFTYKGLPLVRKGNEIYYGNMTDEFVVWIQIVETGKVGDLDVAKKVRLYKIATSDDVPPNEKIANTAEKSGLYEALDIASAWLSCQAG